MDLKDCLARCLVVELRAMARQQELRLQSLLKVDIISQLGRKILEWTQSRCYQRDLPEADRAALSMVMDRGGAIRLSDLETAFGQFRRPVPGGIESSQPWGDGLSTPLDRLHVWGLLFLASGEGEAEPQALIPAEVLEILRPAPPTRPSPFRTCAPPPVPAGPSPYLREDLVLLVSALRTAPAARLANGNIARRDMLRLNSQLLSPDEIVDAGNERGARRLSFLRSIGTHLSLVAATGDRFTVGEGIDRWLALSPEEQQKALITAFIEMHGWLLLDDIPPVQFVNPPSLPVVSTARRFILALLTEAGPQDWHTIASLAQAVRSRNSLVLRRPGDGITARCAESGRALTARDWMIVEGAWIESMARGPLYWLGVLEPGRTRRGEVTSFRLVEGAATAVRAALGLPGENAGSYACARPHAVPTGADSAAADPTSVDPTAADPAVMVEPDLGVRVDCRADAARWYRIERVCDLVERGPVSRYRLSREKVREALQAGVTLDAILADLGESLPGPAAEMLRTWSNRFGQVRVFRASVLSAADPALMNELRAAPEVGECLDSPLGSRASKIIPGKEREVIAHLRRRGEMPHVEEPASRSELSPAVLKELRCALMIWEEAARESGKPPPSPSTLNAVETLLSAAERDTADSGQATVTLLEEAIRRNRAITLDYQDPRCESGALMVVLPRSLGQKQGVTYVSGYRRGGSNLEQFRLDYIRGIVHS